MIVYKGLTSFNIPDKTVVTLGKFDGIHMGHMALINSAAKIARDNNAKLCIFTFDILPSVSFGKFEASMITTNEEKRKMFEEAKVDYLVEFPFNEFTRSMEPIDFISKIMIECMNAAYVVCGNDWRFGIDRSGNIDTLMRYKDEFGYELFIIDKEKYDNREISSTWIRREIADGNMENVNILLGYPYMVMGEVLQGKHLGRELGFATINIYPSVYKILPPNGVYASKVIRDTKEYYSITNIGVRPTVDNEEKLSIETHIFDFDENIYGETVKIELLHFIRPEMKFDTIDKLVSQVESDIKFTKTFFLI